MKTYLTIVACAILFLSSCAQKKSDQIEPPADFPNKTGDQYTYQVSDSIQNNSYNVNLKIGQMSTLDNGTPVMMWIYSYPDHADTSYVSANIDSVVFYGNKQTTPAKIDVIDLYQFPLKVGAKWRTSFIGDTSTVVEISNLTIGGKTYDDVYHIHDHGHSYNYSISKDIWYKPNIGIIRKTYKTLGANQTWQLISYELN